MAYHGQSDVSVGQRRLSLDGMVGTQLGLLSAMRIAVTGVSGFIGSAVVSALAARRHKVKLLGRDVLGDIATFADWPRVVGYSEVVVHLAALAHQRGASEERLRAANVNAAAALAGAAAAAGARMVFIGSVKALGEETRSARLDEASALAPQDAYGRVKAEAERVLSVVKGLKLTVLRSPLVYGPGVKANFLALLRAVDRGWPLPLSSVHNRRSLIYVGNLVDTIVRCAERPEAAGRTYLVSDGEPVSTPNLIRAIARALDRPARLFPFPPRLLERAGALAGRTETVRRLTRSLEVDDSAIRRELGWRPPYTFEEGIRLTAQWFREGHPKRSR